MRRRKSTKVLPFPSEGRVYEGEVVERQVRRTQDGKVVVEVHHYYHYPEPRRKRVNPNKRAFWLVVITVLALAISHL